MSPATVISALFKLASAIKLVWFTLVLADNNTVLYPHFKSFNETVQFIVVVALRFVVALVAVNNVVTDCSVSGVPLITPLDNDSPEGKAFAAYELIAYPAALVALNVYEYGLDSKVILDAVDGLVQDTTSVLIVKVKLRVTS